jgi:outer membrane receptor protein involved in Fe transport
LQDVPIAVTALTSDMLEDQQIQSGSDLQLVTPSLNFQGNDAGGGAFNIRGITNLAVSATAESGVEIHVNDLPVGSTTMQDGEFLDMERIEVLRGPQGTLYGKNSVGGAINLITARPRFDELTQKVSVDLGDYNLEKLRYTINYPLAIPWLQDLHSCLLSVMAILKIFTLKLQPLISMEGIRQHIDFPLHGSLVIVRIFYLSMIIMKKTLLVIM